MPFGILDLKSDMSFIFPLPKLKGETEPLEVIKVIVQHSGAVKHNKIHFMFKHQVVQWLSAI